jgi:hypothetical protein
MDILSFKIKDNGYTVEYTGMNIVRITSSDRPRTELFQKLNLLIQASRFLFKFPFDSALFSSLSISHGDAPKSRLIMEIPVPGNDAAKLQCPAIVRAVRLDPKTEEYLEEDPRNVYNQCVSAVEIEIKKYVRGKRQQMSFEFSADETDEMAEIMGVDDPEVKKVSAWQRQQAKRAGATGTVLPFEDAK